MFPETRLNNAAQGACVEYAYGTHPLGEASSASASDVGKFDSGDPFHRLERNAVVLRNQKTRVANVGIDCHAR